VFLKMDGFYPILAIWKFSKIQGFSIRRVIGSLDGLEQSDLRNVPRFLFGSRCQNNTPWMEKKSKFLKGLKIGKRKPSLIHKKSFRNLFSFS